MAMPAAICNAGLAFSRTDRQALRRSTRSRDGQAKELCKVVVREGAKRFHVCRQA